MISHEHRREARAILHLALPIAAAELGLTLIGIVDVAVLGHSSAVDLGGAAIGRAVNFSAATLGIGVAGALEPLAAQAFGAGDRRGAWDALLGALADCAIVWVLSSLAAWLTTFFFGAFGVEDDLIAPARDFLVAQLPGILSLTIFFTVKSYLQAAQRTRSPLVGSIVANLLNVVLSNLLVRGDDALVAVGLRSTGSLPKLGAFGAGIASSLSMTVLAVWVLAAAWRMRPERPFANVRRLALRKILRIGAPIGLQMLAEIGVFSVLAVLAGRLGHVAAAAHQVTYTLWSFPYMAALGIGGAVAARVGHAIGDRRAAGDVGFVGIALGGAIMLVPALLLVVLRYPLVALFTNDPETIELGVSLLLVAAAFQVFDGVREVAAGALRGAADVRYAFLTNLGAHLLIGLPLALWLAFGLGWGARGLWLGTFASFALIAILLPLRFRALSKGLIARA